MNGDDKMKILIATDSYKGSLNAKEVCEAISNGLCENDSNIETICLPLSDGGEGFTNCMAEICKAEMLYTKCHDIYGKEINGHILAYGDTAIIDSATASGLQGRKNVMQASSYGTGELIKYAKQVGFSNIILGLGGTGCCDGGIGALAALGGIFYDENWNIISKPKANDMNFVFGIDFRNIVKDINFTFACDVENEYFGKNGAAYVFAPQKGARKTDVVELDEGLQRMNAFFKNDISKIKGAGAAGGICGGLYSIYGGEIKSGFDIIAEKSDFENLVKECDIVITGEGKTDKQTVMGKLPYKVCEIAKRNNKKCIVISGSIEDVTLGDKMISLVDENTTVEYAIEHAYDLLKEKAKSILQ